MVFHSIVMEKDYTASAVDESGSFFLKLENVFIYAPKENDLNPKC